MTERCNGPLGMLAAGRFVSDHAYSVTACALLDREIADVAKQASDGRSQDVKDAKRRQEWLAAQNQRSWMVIVSPGRTLKYCGTVALDGTPLTVRTMVKVVRLARGVKPPAIATAVSTVMLFT